MVMRVEMRDLASEVAELFEDAQALLPTAAHAPQFSRDSSLRVGYGRARGPLGRRRVERAVLHLLVRDL
jgi:hypothetical protein